jgi:TRAP-type C4-dicarboxylate transport system permease small subunit
VTARADSDREAEGWRGPARLALRGVDRLNAALTAVVGLLLFVVTAAVLGQVLVRFVLTAFGLNVSAPWTEELARYALIWMVFLGAGVGCRKAQLIALEIVVQALPGIWGRDLRYVALLACLGFFALLIQVGLPFVDLGRTEMSPVTQIPKSRVYWAMPVGAAVMIVNTLALIAESVVERRDIREIGGVTGE